MKEKVKQESKVNSDLLILDCHAIKSGRCLFVDKLTPKELHSILSLKNNKKSSSDKYFQKLFRSNNLEWSALYILPRMATIDTYLRYFQYQTSNNTLYLNNELFIFDFKNYTLSK